MVEGGDDLVQEGDVEFFVKVEYAFHFFLVGDKGELRSVMWVDARL